MKILLLGATGQVGSELARRLPGLGELVTTSRAGPTDIHLDTGDLGALRATLDRVGADLVVNATAYTAVDRAESEPALAMRLNGEVPATIGTWAARQGARVVHYSTDYVFDGSKDSPYLESDTPNPLNSYGRSKLAGDQALLASGCEALILRVSWVYGLRGHNFLLTMRRLMAERDRLSIVDDQVGSPTWSGTIAQATADILGQLRTDPGAWTARHGLYHLAPAGETSWFGFAGAIRDALRMDCILNPIPTSDYPTPATRPANSRMACGKLEKAFGLQLPDWRAAMQDCLAAFPDEFDTA